MYRHLPWPQEKSARKHGSLEKLLIILFLCLLAWVFGGVGPA